MSIFFNEDQAELPEINTSWNKGTRTNFMENAKASFNAFRRSEIFTSERNNLAEEYGNIVQILHDAGHTDFVSPLDLEFDPFGGSTIPQHGRNIKTRAELEKDFWEKIGNLQLTDERLRSLLVEAKLDTPENMQKVIAEKSHKAWEEYAKINERASGEWYTGGGKTGGFVGIAGAAFTDPIMLATIPVSFGYSVPATFTKAAWKMARYEMVILAVAETMIQLKVQPYRKELGFEDAGLETGLKNIAMVTAASGVLSPVLLGVFKAFGKSIEVGKKHLFKLSDNELNQVGKELGELNPKYKDTDLDNYKFPEKDNPFPDTASGRTEHRERLNAAAKSVNESTPLDLPPAKNHIVSDNLEPPVNIKPGEFAEIFDASGNIIKTQIVKVSRTGRSVKIKLGDGTERVISLDPNAGVYQNIRNPNYVIRSPGVNAQGKSVSSLSKTELNAVRKKLIKTKEELEKSGQTNQGAYTDAVQDLNSIDFNVNKATTSVNSPRIEKATFNKNETKLAEDLNNVKDFDVPNEAAYRNQALNNERSVFDVSTSNPIKSEAGTGAAAKTSPTELSDATQALSKGSQTTDATPVSVLAKANTEPPLFRGSVTNRVGDISDISKDFIYHKSDNFNEIYNTLSKKMNDVKKDLQPITTKYNGDLKARIKEKKELNKKLNKGKLPQHISDYLGARISTDTIFQAKMVLSDLNKQIKFIQIDDFLSDTGRTASEYRAIHAQALTDDGFSFELQIRVKDLDPLTEKSHTIYKKKKWAEKEYTDAEYNKIVKEEAEINKKLKAKYFEIKDKEFSRLNSKNEVDVPIIIGTRLDESTGEKVALTKTARELFEEEGKDKTMMKRLEECMGW